VRSHAVARLCVLVIALCAAMPALAADQIGIYRAGTP
jgi:hypothetical protein